ncbi:MAG: CDP-alcohol phosphatidyltransferase family protein [Ignavibacteriae bacterium]|nr:CDP-alcohol phosphatidyltransferase family protein [Ignavibacteriota bacterium]MCB9216391.1 CDP-alcohol phosphatidyltransferase family protein [Ignavibacteria bacterium]
MEVKSTSQRSAEDGSEVQQGSLWGASNLLSIARLLMTLPTCLLVYYGHRDLAVISFFVAAFTDYLDGWVARRFNQISDLGKILDPLADKVYVAGVVILLATLGVIPLWFLLPILLRDLLILVGGIYVERKTGEVLPSNWTGKWAVGVLSITLLLFYLEVNGIALQIFIVITLAMLSLSLFLYVKRAYAHLQSL